ncbi:MAG: spermidine/putrescine ABC transporter substrate-binding protein [Solirubrobacterales bacterium]
MSERNKKNPGKLFLLSLAGLAASLAIAACGGGGISEGTDSSEAPTAAAGNASGTLNISNWPLYIDEETISDFEKESGIKVNYTEDVNSNTDFFGKVQPLLANGDSGGRSILTVTDWMSQKMWDLGYLQKLDPNALEPIFDNLIPSLQDPAFDPGRTYSIPWQSGMTGLVVRTDLAPDIKSINDLFDPAYKGKITMLDELRDTVPLVMKADGIDPVNASTQDWLDAIDKIKQAKNDGQIRRFTGNDYVQDLAKGDVVAAVGWSGDAVQAQADNENIEYIQPEQGCMIWSDNMSIPLGAPNSPAAYEFMNYVYEPANQAQIVEYVNYITPVSGVKEILAKQDPALAESELIFPSEEFLADCTNQVSPPGDEAAKREVENAWVAVTKG